MSKFITISFLTSIFLIAGCSQIQNGSVDNSNIISKELSEKNDYSTDSSELTESQPTQTVELQDGETFTLTAKPITHSINGQKLRMLGYNGMIPGPTIRIEQGSSITLNLKNETEEETLLHSHGIRMNEKFDGTHLGQNPIKPGETFAYQLTFPDAGIYWYHPHLREDYAQEMGLYGNFLVVPKDKNYWSSVNREVSLIIDDILLYRNKIMPFSKTSVDYALMGRYGNTMLVNGETDYQLTVSKNEVVRFFMTNAANARPFRLSIPGIKMKLVGSDSGRIQSEKWVEEITLAPSERSVIEVSFSKSGEFTLINRGGKKEKLTVITVSENEVTDQSPLLIFNMLRNNPEFQDLQTMVDESQDRSPDKTLRLTMFGTMMEDHQRMMGIGMMPSSLVEGKIEWEDDMGHMNGMSTTDMITWKLVDEETQNVNSKINWNFKKGQLTKLRLINDLNSMHPMQHPIHIHGQRFLVAATNGQSNDNLVWKDTVLVGTGDTVDLLVEMSNPGNWMLHCHISEHLSAGMALTFKVK